MKWILVQHSGFIANGNKQFTGGLEEEQVNDVRAERLKAAGYAVYDSYFEASRAAFRFMYPENYEGLIPIADTVGTFGPSIGRFSHIFRPKETSNEAHSVAKTQTQSTPTAENTQMG